MPKRILFSTLIIISFALSMMWSATRNLKDEVWAAKVRTSRGATTSKSSVYTGGGKVTTSVKFRGDRRAVIINFAGLANAKQVSYSLTYNSNGVPQGVMGTITNPTVSVDSREVLFGTCSGGVCRYHQNITNAKLVITSKLKSGYTTRKTYKIKI